MTSWVVSSYIIYVNFETSPLQSTRLNDIHMQITKSYKGNNSDGKSFSEHGMGISINLDKKLPIW